MNRTWRFYVQMFQVVGRCDGCGESEFVESVVTATSEEMAQEWDVISVTYEIVSQALEVLDIGVQSHADLEHFLAIAEAGIKVLAAGVSGREASIWSLIVKGGSKWWGRISELGYLQRYNSNVGSDLTVDVFSGVMYASYDRGN